MFHEYVLTFYLYFRAGVAPSGLHLDVLKEGKMIEVCDLCIHGLCTIYSRPILINKYVWKKGPTLFSNFSELGRKKHL